MSKTIAIIGSSRRNGNTGQLLDCIAEKLAVEVIDLSSKNISPFDYEHKNIDDDFLSLMDHVLEYDNIIFASPVYWYAMSAQMKIFIDRISDLLSVDELQIKGRELRGKVAYVVSTSINETIDNSFLDSFVHTFEYLGIQYGGCIHIDCNKGFDEKSNQIEIVNFVKKLESR